VPHAEHIKCVVWDLDGTVWQDTAVELPAGHRPRVFAEARHAITVLHDRGIINSVASRTDPSVAEILRNEPDLERYFVANQLGWGHKSDAIRRVADQLGIDSSAVAFVDDDPFERAEVAAMLPDVLVMAPAELYGRLDTPLLSPAVVTEESRRRAERYREEEHRRQAEAAFTGDREEFLRGCAMRLEIGPAGDADLDRLAEMVERTHRFNSTGLPWARERLGEVVHDGGWFTPVARLRDRFGDYGLIGAALVERGTAPGGRGEHPSPDWRLHLLTVSCRAVGRGVPAEFLGRIMSRARAAGAGRLLMDVRQNRANVDLRVLLRQQGFRAVEGPDAVGGLLTRPLSVDLPAAVPWLDVIEESNDDG
jgi:FkbH-like protein